MAIRNGQGNYLKIVNTDCINTINYQIWKDQGTREEPTEFDIFKNVAYTCDNLQTYLLMTANPDLSVLNNVKTKCYQALKATYDFMGWEDC